MTLWCRIFGCVVQCFIVKNMGPDYRCFGDGECCRCRQPLIPQAKVL